MEIEIEIKIQESPSEECLVPNKYRRDCSCSLLSSHSVTSEAIWKSEVTRYLPSQMNPPAALPLILPSPTEAFTSMGDPQGRRFLPWWSVPPESYCPT